MKDHQELHVIPCWVWGESLPIRLLSGLSCLLDQVEHKLGRGEFGQVLVLLYVPADHLETPKGVIQTVALPSSCWCCC